MGSLPQPELTGAAIASRLVPSTCSTVDDGQDPLLLCRMSRNATKSIAPLAWCGEVLESYFGRGLGGVFFTFVRLGAESTFASGSSLATFRQYTCRSEDCRSAAEAFRMYIRPRSKWVAFARLGQAGPSEQGVPLIELPVTPEYAGIIAERLYGLTKPYNRSLTTMKTD
jgi:hypothetical protein